MLPDVGLASFVSQRRYATIIWSNCFDFTQAGIPPPLILSLASSSRGICYLTAERILDGWEGAGPTALPAMLPGEAIALSPPLFAEAAELGGESMIRLLIPGALVVKSYRD